MAGKAILTCRTNSHPFQERTLNLEQPVKIGRSVARSRPAANNAIFDCKVLSRNHAVIWYANGKFFLQDTKSSNGTFVNNQRLSKSGEESNPREISSGDIVQFGVDVLENSRKVTHGCIIANLLLYLPDGKEAKASDTITVSFSKLIQVEDLYELHQYLQDAIQREHLLETKLLALQAILNNVRESADHGWKALIAEDSLLTRVEALENQLQLYSKTFGEDKLKDDLKKLQEDKTEYQTTAKIFLKRILDEKLDVEQKHDEAKRSLVNLEAQCINLTEELSQSRTHIQELAQKLSEQTTRTEESDAKLQELQEQHIDSLGKLENKNQELENLLARQQTISIDRKLAFEHQPKSLGDENEEDTNKENRISNIAVDESELKNSLETQAKSKEYLELIQAQRDLLRAQKLAYVQQLNDLQDENYLSKKQDVEEIEDRIEKLESHEAQVRSACDNFSSETKDEKEDVKRLTNGRDEVLEAKLKELKALHYEAKENKGPCENRTDLSNENIEIVKDGLRRTSAIYLITQENLEKAQKDYEESYLRSPTLAEPVKLKNEFLFIEGSDSQEIEDDVIRKEDEEITEKNPDESEHDEATLKHKKSESVSSEEPSSLATEVDSYSTFESNKLLEELLLAQYNYSVSLKIIASMETEIENLKYDFSKLQTENKNLHKSYLLHEEREDLDDLDKKNPIDDREKLIVNLNNPDDQDEMKVDQTNPTDDRDEIKVDQNNPISDRDELIEKITNLEEKLVTLASQYMKCNDERLALSQQLSTASLDSPQPSLFNLLFTLPSVLLILALAVIFYPSLSHFMGTADFPEDHH